MKKKKYAVILIIGFLLGAKDGVAQDTLKTPYPIIFIHGLIGNHHSWQQDGEFNDVIDYLEGAGLKSGGSIDITLDHKRDTLNLSDSKEDDVYLFTTNPPKADFYIINFDVHATGVIPHDIPNWVFLESNFVTSHVYPGDIEISVTIPAQFFVGDIIRIENEYMLVTSIGETSITVIRHIFNSIVKTHDLGNIVWNLSCESNQASIAKQGLGLKLAIEKIKIKTGTDKVILVGHSMGGLAAREYIRSYFSNDVAKIVTIGTPHYGSNLAAFPGLPFSFQGLDPKSDACRDLKMGSDSFFNYILFGYLGVYLFGGNESSVPNEFYSKDLST